MSKIVFVCVENSCRSQMAEGFARYYGKGKVEVFSAGSRPSGKVNETAVQVMKEVGIDISSQASKGFDALPYKEFDMVVTMGCGDECPVIPKSTIKPQSSQRNLLKLKTKIKNKLFSVWSFLSF